MAVFRCPHCGARINFDPALQSMKCDYCDSEITLDDYRQALAKMGRMVVNEQSCPQCGATLLTTDDTIATFCSYCGSSVSMDSRVTEVDAPQTIVPFKWSKTRAINAYRKKVTRTLLAPDWMTADDTVTRFRGIYMPFHMLNYTFSGPRSATARTETTERRGGATYDVTTTYAVDGTLNVNYSGIPVDGATGFPDSMSRAIVPFRKHTEVPFEQSYLAGFYADRSSADTSLYKDTYQAAVIENINNKPDIPASRGVSVATNTLTPGINLTFSSDEALFPVWFLSHRNKDKVNYAAVNGETGEIAADIPLDFRKFLVASTLLAALICLVLNLFFTIKPDNLLLIVAALACVVTVVAFRLSNSTYRRVKHYDDPGYLGEQADILTDSGKNAKTRSTTASAAITVAKVIGATIAALLLLVALIMLDFSENFITIVLVGCFIGIPVFASATGTKSPAPAGTKVRRRRAPLSYQLRIIIKPLLAIAACLVVALGTGSLNGVAFRLASVDEYCYLAAFFGIAMVIWAAFDVVRAHNRFTMRDIPIFTEKRGGEE